MKLNEEILKRIIREELDNILYEAGDFNPQYRAQQMMKGGGRVMMAVKDPNSYENEIYDDEGNPGRDETMFFIYRALQNADTVANRLRTGDMEEAKRIGTNSLSDFQEAERLIRADLKPPKAGGLKYMTSMVEGVAAHIFMVRIISVVQ
tara:strand:- start:327 stop:773 length:447 start_codon:yes stop_codon:yes gene_type:complete